MNPVTGKIQNTQISRDIGLCLSLQKEQCTGCGRLWLRDWLAMVSSGDNENALKLIMVMAVQS